MVFSSNLFLYVLLLPIVTVHAAALILRRGRADAANLVILVVSLALYYWTNGPATILLVVTIVATAAIGRRIGPDGGRAAPVLLWLGIVLNLSILVYYKYFDFLAGSLLPADVAAAVVAASPLRAAALPVGISFYTFMAVSYLLEVRRGRVAPSSLPDFATYLSMFPHLIAGPIVRFSEIGERLRRRSLTLDGCFEGAWRFCLGLAQKAIIATPLGEAADAAFKLAPEQLTPKAAWLGAAAYTLQIYFDFAGYSSMAIGLALMIGFRFPENFDAPYRATSVTDFWRRWHMTLTRWFRDYVYIPLGGNRRGRARTLANLFAVFALCGLWHGAALTFVIWGLYHGLLLVAERVVLEGRSVRLPAPLGWALTMLLVMIGWVIFRAGTPGEAWGYLQAMAGLSGADAVAGDAPARSTIATLLVGTAFALVPWGRVRPAGLGGAVEDAFKAVAAPALLACSVVMMSDATYSPFIYFRF